VYGIFENFIAPQLVDKNTDSGTPYSDKKPTEIYPSGNST
jgi:hypothetical protein